MIFQTLKIVWKNRNILLIAAIIVAFGFNLFKMKAEIKALRLKHKAKPFVFIGSQFEGILPAVKDASWIGYYTDRSLDNRFAAAQFAQAQYVLAPILLDLNSTNHQLVIFDFQDKTQAIKHIKKLGLMPIQLSPSGIILAKNPKL